MYRCVGLCLEDFGGVRDPGVGARAKLELRCTALPAVLFKGAPR